MDDEFDHGEGCGDVERVFRLSSLQLPTVLGMSLYKMVIFLSRSIILNRQLMTLYEDKHLYPKVASFYMYASLQYFINICR